MGSENMLNTADSLLRPVANVKIGAPAAPKKPNVVKEELHYLRLEEIAQEKIMDTLTFIHGPDFKLKSASAYENEKSNLGKKFWIGQGNLVVRGGCDNSLRKDTAEYESDRIKQFALYRLESYGFHPNHCLEAFQYCEGNIEDALYLLYSKYFNLPYPFPAVNTNMSTEELLEQRIDEKSSLESIYEKSFEEKVKTKVWIIKLKLDYLVKIFHNKTTEKPKQTNNKTVKKKEKCKLFVRGNCKYGDKCRFSHEVEEVVVDPNVHLTEFVFELEIRFPPESQYPFEPPMIFLKTNAVLPELVNLHICKRLLDEAKILAVDGMPSVYTVVELLQNEEEICEHLKHDIDFIHPKMKLFHHTMVSTGKRKTDSHYRRGVTNKDNKRVFTLEQINKENSSIVARYQRKLIRDDFRSILESRKSLPAWKYMNDIVNTVESSQVTIISGETGCGKSTQVPQFLLDNWIANYDSKPKLCNIVCTQPRRISAIGVAERVAQERIENAGNTVGYQIRLDSMMSASTRLLFCTTGILLRRLESEPLIPDVTHIVVDEVHERSEESDFLLMILRQILPERPDLKVILMSATLNAELFSTYFSGVPIIEIPGRTFPVTQYFLEDIFDSTDYILEEGTEYTKRIVKDENYLECELDCADVTYVSAKPKDAMKDEILSFRQLCARYEGYSKTTLKNLFLMDTDKINNDLIEFLLTWIVSGEHEYPRKGTILVFLPGIAEITSLYDLLRDHREFGTRSGKFLLLPLHSSLTNEEQAAIFKKPKTGVRKIVLSTNLAETSITIDDCVFVIDSGKMKEKRFDPNRNMESLDTTWVTRANALQRKGRAGRVLPGVCFHLYTSNRFKHHFLAQPIPEIHRVPLEQLILNIKLLQTFENIDVKEVLAAFIEPPVAESVDSSISRLQGVGALDKDMELTALGGHLATLPVDVRIGKLILYGAIFSCVDAALTMAACLSFKSPFLTPFDKKELANAKKMEFSTGFSDQITVYIAYNKWLQVFKKSSLAARNYANENYLSFKTLVSIADVKHQFLELLVDIGFVSANLKVKRRMGEDNVINLTGTEFNKNAENLRLLSSIICSALYPNVVKVLTPSKSFIMSSAGAIPKDVVAKDLQFATVQEKVFMHPSSVNYKVSHFSSPFLVYQEKIKTSRIFFRDCSMVPLMSLVLFSGFDLDIKVQNGFTFVSLENGWIMLQVEEHKIAEMIKMIRLEFLELLEEKIRDPLLNLQHSIKSNKIISTILHLIST